MRPIYAVIIAMLLLAAPAHASTLSLTAAKRATRATAANEVSKMRHDSPDSGAVLFAGPVCKRLAPRAMRCAYRIQFQDLGYLQLTDHHVLVTLSYGYALARRVPRDHTYAQGLERVPALKP